MVKREFIAFEQDELWLTDITEHATGEGKLYLCAIKDVFSNRIVGTAFEHGAVVFFDLSGGLKLALWPRASLAHETGLPAGSRGGVAHALAHNVATRDEVDALLAQAARAGATIVKPAQDTFYGGYAGWFEDPDGHVWEVAWNPKWPVED